MSSRLQRFGSLLLVSALLLGACGGDDDSDDGSGGGLDAGASGSIDIETPGLGGAIGAGAALGLFGGDCREAVAAFAEIQLSIGSAFAGGNNVDQYEQQLQALADDAPDELKDDFQVFADEMGPFYEGIAKIFADGGNISNPQVATQLGELSEQIDNDALSAASDNIEAYFDGKCGD